MIKVGTKVKIKEGNVYYKYVGVTGVVIDVRLNGIVSEYFVDYDNPPEGTTGHWWHERNLEALPFKFKIV